MILDCVIHMLEAEGCRLTAQDMVRYEGATMSIERAVVCVLGAKLRRRWRERVETGVTR